jgi:hypothetical protein
MGIYASSRICQTSSETCDNVDNDGDGQVDEGLSRQCGVSDIGNCTYGTETCSAGSWGDCDAVLPVTEVCDNGQDDDCDGLTDQDDGDCFHLVDKDTDGFTKDVDCDDDDDTIHPGAEDLPDTSFVDANCDGIDGDKDDAVFVSTTGSAGNTGLTTDQPKQTVAQGLAVAVANGRSQVLIRMGTYDEVVVLSGAYGSLGFYGAYGSDWSRHASNTTVISGEAYAGHYLTVWADNASGVTFASLELKAPNASGQSSGYGKSSYAVNAVNSTLTFNNVDFDQGNGANGQDGTDGSNASPSPAQGGDDGQDGYELSACCDDTTRTYGGSGGINSSCASANGGDGGDGGKVDTSCSCVLGICSGNCSASSGLAGSNATTYVTDDYGYHGSAGGVELNGLPGDPGRPPIDGSGGPSGNTEGFIYSSRWWAANQGGDGSLGQHGTGGGGGGGGGGSDSGIDDLGGAGGGGGAGGCRAPAYGQGGKGGGGSFGIFALNSTIYANGCHFSRGNGGRGGDGGYGGPGQPGGSGGSGGSGSDNSGAGGSGGNGTRGGHSGGGAGGNGGHSYGIYTYSTTVIEAGNIYEGGEGGYGGAESYSPGHNGDSGITGLVGYIGTMITL